MKKGLFKLIFITGLIGLLLVTGAVMAEENGAPSGNSPTVATEEEPELYFAKAILPKTRLYLGERVPLTIRLYIGEIRVDKVDPPSPQQPEFDFGPVVSDSQGKIDINGNPYRLLQFNLSLVPLKTGKLSVNPVTLNCIVVQTVPVILPSGETGHRIIQRNLEVKTPKQTVQVLALPQKGQPPGFSGGIGNFKLTLNPGSAVIRQGDSFTVKMTVSGSGNLSKAGIPQLESSAGLKVFPPQKTGEDRPGRVGFEQLIIPLDDKMTKIGPFFLNYFDPDTGKYRKATATLAVKIKFNPEFQKEQTILSPGEDQQTAPEPAALKDHPGDWGIGSQLLLNQRWFWLLQLIPLAAFLVALYFRNYQRMLNSDSSKARTIKASRKSVARLAAVKTLLAEGESGKFLEELHLILREYLGEKFNLPVAGMTETVVETLKTMAPDLEPEILTRIHQFFTGYDARRFTGATIQPEEGAGLWEEVNGIIESLNRYRA